MMQIDLHINLRPHQRDVWQGLRRMNVIVAHRRWGKTWLCVARLVTEALTTNRKNARYAFVGQTYVSTKATAWLYLREFTENIPGVQFNESELRCILPNGAEIRLWGAEAYERMRGLYLDGVVLDECALIPTEAWSAVISPMLSDRTGWAIFISTPRGRANLFHELFTQADEHPDWFRTVQRASETGVLPQAELDRMRRAMTAEEYAQELDCSFNAAIRGAYFAQEMAAADEQGRITRVPFDPSFDVGVALDLGWSDLMVAITFQDLPQETRILHCQAYQQTDLAGLVRELRKLDHAPAYCLAPHDIVVTEMTSGQSRQQTLENLGLPVRVVPRVKDKHEAIDQARRFLPRCWFNKDSTHMLVEALNGYRSDYDAVRRIHKTNPLHSWESHYADAFMTMACGERGASNWAPMKLPARYATMRF